MMASAARVRNGRIDWSSTLSRPGDLRRRFGAGPNAVVPVLREREQAIARRARALPPADMLRPRAHRGCASRPPSPAPGTACHPSRPESDRSRGSARSRAAHSGTRHRGASRAARRVTVPVAGAAAARSEDRLLRQGPDDLRAAGEAPRYRVGRSVREDPDWGAAPQDSSIRAEVGRCGRLASMHELAPENGCVTNCVTNTATRRFESAGCCLSTQPTIYCRARRTR